MEAGEPEQQDRNPEPSSPLHECRQQRHHGQPQYRQRQHQQQVKAAVKDGT